ncbi:hypothetical protein QYE76_071719 [Lolium multiflorum]|uniref:SWIM-type domain-containing protein n=1 Tax=Lolium multiflorum TaxID=4521 RepID=A0AAD8WH37_LOLMU|nr:hypothetical protein QYE76_071719 [Lolium multiflorum]
MEEPTNPGGGDHDGGEQGWRSGVSSGGEGQAGGGHEVDARSGVEDLEELWPSQASNSAAMLAQIWVDNPESSERFTFSLGGIDLDPEVWEVKIQLDGLDNLERRIARDDITVMNLYAMIETHGFGFSDSMYCRQGEDMVLIENNEQLYHLLEYFEETEVLLPYPVVYDLTPPPIYVVDGEGTVFATQSSYFGTQERRNDEAREIPDLSEATNVDLDFDMGVADFNMMEEMRRKEQAEVAERIEEMRQQRMDPLLHCEGDTDIEDLFVTEEVDVVPLDSVPPIIAPEPVAIVEPEKKKKKKKKKKRKGPTVRSHSSVQIDDILDWKPEAVEDMDAGFVDDMDDDHFEPLTMVPPKGGRKSRAKKRPPRKWYDERRLQPHEQLCLKMCFRDVHQFREALINLHISQSRHYVYHRNSNVIISVQCIQEKCPFYMVASEIKGFRGEDLKKCMDATSYAFHKDEFDIAMDNLKAESEDAWKWLSAIPVHTWARHAFDTSCKTDLVVHNLSEVFNKYILDVRKKPIRTMIEGIKNKMMTMNHEKRVGGTTARWEITPHFSELLEMAKKFSRFCTPRVADIGHWQVTNSKGTATHVVNFEARSCGCRRWDVTGLPCNHASFKPVIYPVPGQHDWTKTDTPDIVPPEFTIHRGSQVHKMSPTVEARLAYEEEQACASQGDEAGSSAAAQAHAPTSRAPAPTAPAARATAPTSPAARAPAPTVAATRPPANEAPTASSTIVPRSHFIPPRPAAPDGQGPGPAYKITRTCGYFNCGYAPDGEEGGSTS